MTLDELKIQALVCTSCRLAERRTNVVFGEGDPRSPLVLVGEGPGDQEDKTGRPLVEAGLSRDMVYICNTVKCRAADWSAGKPQNRPPADDETLACRQWLIPQLGMIAPKVILCVGAPSAKNLIKKNFLITKERGLYFPCEYSKTAMATLHPSYILRQQRPDNDGGFSLLIQDIQRSWAAAQKLVEKETGAQIESRSEIQETLF